RDLRALGARRLRRTRRRIPDRARCDALRPRRSNHLRLVLHRAPHAALPPRAGQWSRPGRHRRPFAGARDARLVRVCLVYDHLFPQTVGGMERWFRDLALRLAQLGHEVTYLTMQHWDDATPVLPGVRVLGLTRPGRVYSESRRTFGPPLRFGLAVARHLRRHGRDYDVVHTGSFPYFPLLAAGALRRRSGYRIV